MDQQARLKAEVAGVRDEQIVELETQAVVDRICSVVSSFVGFVFIQPKKMFGAIRHAALHANASNHGSADCTSHCESQAEAERVRAKSLTTQLEEEHSKTRVLDDRR